MDIPVPSYSYLIKDLKCDILASANRCRHVSEVGEELMVVDSLAHECCHQT